MKLAKLIAGLTGFFLPLIIGKSFEFPEGILLVWICIFAFGFIGKLLLQVFENPFLNSSPKAKVYENHKGILIFVSSVFTFLGLGTLVGELVFFQNVGAFPLSFLIFGISIHLGAHYLKGKNWFFNQ